ncbi:MAG: UpxY family transcription antiterminator [Bryobacterales bacterium]|nr:UpxY family transcription antiterminator [Bryobacterales bacterium]
MDPAISQLDPAAVAEADFSSVTPAPDALLPWYAVRVRSNFEKKVAASLHARGFEEFTPLYHQSNKWSDRVANLEIPLFPGYLFCRLDISKRLPVLAAPGVVSIVGFGPQFITVPDSEIESIRSALDSGALLLPHPYLRAGQRIRIAKGAMTGVEGILLNVRDDYRLVLSINILMRSVSVQIDRDWITPIS